MEWISSDTTASPQTSLYRFRLRVRDALRVVASVAQRAQQKTPGLRPNTIDIYLTDTDVAQIYGTTASAFGPPPQAQTFTATVHPTDETGKPDQSKVTYSINLVSYVQSTNIAVFHYSFSTVDASGKPGTVVHFQLSSTDGAAFFGVICGLLFSNPPNPSF